MSSCICQLQSKLIANIPPCCSYGPLYTAVTTGFCGSLTTFSGWQLDIFESWINGTASHRDWFRDVSN